MKHTTNFYQGLCNEAELHAKALVADIQDKDAKEELMIEEVLKYIMDHLDFNYDKAKLCWEAYLASKQKHLAVLEKGSHNSFLTIKQKGS
jgi:hypothetical protein